MIGEILQEYLVSLGVRIDKPGFQEMDRTIKASEQAVEKTTGAWAANFLKASAAIGSAIAGVTAAVGGLMNSAAKEDLAIQKLARNMMISKDAALEMKRATDALGESVTDILLTPELLDGFQQLTKEGRQMKVGGDFAETMKNFRDLTFEFTRLKQEASYAMTWVGYYLMKYLQKPLNEIGEKFRRFNDAFIKNMSVWTEKIAKAMVYVINIGKHFLEFLWDIGKALYGIWDSFPKGVKIAIASLAGLWAVINASPLGRMIMLVSTLLLLLDDYYGYMEGKDAALGKYWDKLNGYIEAGKRLWEEYKPVVMETLDTVAEYLILARDAVLELAKNADEAFGKLMNSSGMEWFLATTVEIGKALWELGSVILVGTKENIEGFLASMEKNGAVKEFGGLMDRVWRLFQMVYEWIGKGIRSLARFLDTIRKDEDVKAFYEALGELVAVVVELFNAIWDVAAVALKEMLGGFDDTKHAYSFRDALKEVVKMITAMLRLLSSAIRKLSEFFRLMKDSTILRKSWKWLGEVVKEFTNLVLDAIKTVGKLGQALILLVKGDFKGAKNLAGSAIKDFGSRLFGDKKADAVGEFMAAISGQESGGNYSAENTDSGAAGAFQIMPENWPSWAEAAGLGADAPMTQENQNKVARHKMSEYYQQFGNWRDVAIAWYGGPGAVDYSEEAKNRKQYFNGNEYPSINEYADSVMERLEKIQAENRSADAGQNNIAGDAVAENAMNYTVGSQWMGGATDDWRIQCDSFTANVYNASGIPSIGGHSTDNSAGHVINDTAFKDANAWHENDGYIPQNGDLVGWNWSETSGHYGIYNADTDTVVTRDSKSGIQHRTLQEAIDYFGNPTGYGSIAEAEANRKGIIPTASFMPNYEVKPLGSFMGSNTETQNPFGVDLPNLSDIQKMVQDGILTPMRESMPDGVVEKMVQQLQNIDPAILGGLAGGMPSYARNGAGISGNGTTAITIGDINVSVEGGANASAQDIAKATHREFLDQVQKDASFLFGSRALIGSTM